jgi:Flp pilus assembly protein TadB
VALARLQLGLGDTIALAAFRVVPAASLTWAVVTAAAVFDSVIVAVIVVATASLPIMVMLARLSRPARRIRRAG